jgi:preprotein translocase subunit YajC
MPPLRAPALAVEANGKVVSVLEAAQSTGGGSGYLPLLMIVLLFGVMYFMMIRPQQKRRREAEQMQSALAPGDEVVTIGGLHGRIASVDDESVTIEAAPGVHLRYARPAIARVNRSAQPAAPVTDEVDTKE